MTTSDSVKSRDGNSGAMGGYFCVEANCGALDSRNEKKNIIMINNRNHLK